MENILKLINNEKVKWKRLGEVAKCFAGGTPKTSVASYYDGNIPWIRSGEINFNSIKSSERNISEEGLKNSSAKIIRANSVVIAITGATVGRSGIVEFETACNQSVAAVENDEKVLNHKFLYYFVSANYKNIKNMGQGVLTSINLSTIKNLMIPIPSLETQEKVVKILDKLTEYATELRAELLLRNKQYNYYRNLLLNDEYLTKKTLELCGEDAEVEFKQLRDICKIVRGTRITKKDLLIDGLYPVVSGGTGYMGYLNKYNREENTITIAQYGMAGYVNWQNEKFWANDVCFCINPNPNINKRYLYYFLVNNQDYLYSISNRSAIPYSISRDRIYDIQIPIPPLEVQNHIVSILDQFNTLTNDLTQGLPKEIELRQKQYEYYREQLLSFNHH
ncbi:hypothetical protein JM47_02125 [Ureaplasma diversum]|uniref:Type I restriction modification DNA specificity domain-containing protein n=1 Tax=Ureaplasma diversum TaxID=42094 RepID=A0A0C5RLW2_9BACT|nr:restriction endonuclease subunit S [Ureaplasma diversum]AJQ45377.1 hypothetical protein JM47_02125 [Ureaplasma diversum]